MSMQRKVVDVRETLAYLAAVGFRVFAAVSLEEKIEELNLELSELNDTAQAIQLRADEANRDLTEEEGEEIQSILARCKKIRANLAQRQEMLAQRTDLNKPAGRQTTAQGPDAGDMQARGQRSDGNTMPARRIETVYGDKGKWGWKDIGEFCVGVYGASARGGKIDPRFLAAAPSSMQQEGVGGDGGFAVPPDFLPNIKQTISAEGSIYSRTDQQQVSGNGLVVPLDESAPWLSSGAVKAYWAGEAQQGTATKGLLKPHTTKVDKLFCLVYATDELLEDASALAGWINKKAPIAIDFAVSMAIVQGLGAGTPLGILNAPCLITVAKESGQLATTIVAENINKMWSAMYAPCRNNAVWLANQDIEPQLQTMVVRIPNAAGSDFVGGWPLYVPQGGLSAAPYDMLKGRPIVYTQACETLGSLGDIILADLSQYVTVTKIGGMRQDISIHLYFDYDIQAFRFILRIGGQPWWTKALAARSGSTTYSPFVALAQRA